MGKYSFKDLMNRYSMTKSALSKYIANHMDDIGENHAVKTRTGWVFDSEAVKKLDELRNIHTSSPVTSIVVEGISEQEKQRYEDTISNLQQLLLVSQKETADARAETIAAMKENAKLKDQLSLVSAQYAQLAEGKSTVTELELLRSQIKQGFDDVINGQHSTALNVNNGKGWNKRGSVRRIKLSGK